MNFLPNSAKARDVAYFLHPYTNLKTHERDGPLVVTHGKGIYVYDEDGKAYIEGLAGLWCTSLGFSEKRLVKAAAAQMDRLPFFYSFFHRGHDKGIDLAERLIKMAPAPMSKVLFCSSGSEANDAAIKLIWYYNNARGLPKKKKIISRKRAYHGVTIASASLTGLPANHMDFDLPIERILHTDCPHHYRFAAPGQTEEEFATQCAENLEKLILAEDPDTVAGFFAEPVMGAGGVIVPPRTYFEKIQAVLRKYDILLVADEVICGFGRTGNMWGCETFGIKPDMVTVAKALTSAYLPLAATLVSEKMYRAFVSESEKIGTFGHGHTYAAHPVCCAVALETLDIYAERDIVGHVRRVAPRFLDGLGKFADHPLVGEVRGVGLMAAVELVKDKKTKAPFDPAGRVGAYLAARAQDHGLLFRANGEMLAFSPPLIITAEEIDLLLERLGRALDETTEWVRKEGLAAA